MLDKIGIVLPVRDGGTGRSERLKRCLDSYIDVTEGLSNIFVIVDEDEIETYSFLEDYLVTVKIVPAWLAVIVSVSVNPVMADAGVNDSLAKIPIRVLAT